MQVFVCVGVSENRAITYKSYRQNHVYYVKQKGERSIFPSSIMLFSVGLGISLFSYQYHCYHCDDPKIDYFINT